MRDSAAARKIAAGKLRLGGTPCQGRGESSRVDFAMLCDKHALPASGTCHRTMCHPNAIKKRRDAASTVRCAE